MWLGEREGDRGGSILPQTSSQPHWMCRYLICKSFLAHPYLDVVTKLHFYFNLIYEMFYFVT